MCRIWGISVYSEEGMVRRASKTLAFSSMLGSLALGHGALAQDGSEVDLTGTWEGTQVCDVLLGGEFTDFVIIDNPLLVVQDGDRFRFLYVGESEEEVADDLVYEGVIQRVEGSDHSEAMAGICGGDFEAEEIVRLRRIETSEDEGRFDAESIFFTDDFPPVEGVLTFSTCKWAYERVSTEPPDVPECERPGIRATHDEGN
jgi:hypothetical protein